MLVVFFTVFSLNDPRRFTTRLPYVGYSEQKMLRSFRLKLFSNWSMRRIIFLKKMAVGLLNVSLSIDSHEETCWLFLLSQHFILHAHNSMIKFCFVARSLIGFPPTRVALSTLVQDRINNNSPELGQSGLKKKLVFSLQIFTQERS